MVIAIILIFLQQCQLMPAIDKFYLIFTQDGILRQELM